MTGNFKMRIFFSPIWINTLLFCPISTKFVFFFAYCQNMIFSHNWYFLKQLPKTGKICDILRISFEYWIELHSIPGKSEKTITSDHQWEITTDTKKLSILHENPPIFWKWGVPFHKSKNFRKTNNFSRWESPSFTILFGKISKFWAQILPSP